MMTVSSVSRNTTRKTGTANTWGAMLAVATQACVFRWEDTRGATMRAKMTDKTPSDALSRSGTGRQEGSS